MSFEDARRVADAILYEGYVLYPYRASAAKNQVRWQFGVLMPRSYSEGGTGEQWFSQTECLIEPGMEAVLHMKLRFLHLQARMVERAEKGAFKRVGSLRSEGQEYISWDEVVEQEVDASVGIDELLEEEQIFAIDSGEDRTIESINDAAGEARGRIVRQRWPVSGALRVSARRFPPPFPAIELRIRTENLTSGTEPSLGRDEALKHSLIAAHTLLGLSEGRFISLIDPPEWARAAADSCSNLHTFPVLIGDGGARDAMLSSPIILYDYPQTAPESPGDLYDATEIDEILTLRTMALTEEEKNEARLTDQRAAAIIERTDTMPPEIFEKLHGAIRYVGGAAGESQNSPAEVPWWDPGVDASVSPDTDSVLIGDVSVAKGSKVRLTPGSRRADAQDMFLAGRTARVEGVFLDVDDNRYLAVTLEDDPGADLHQWHGRFLYFNPDEVEPLKDTV
ncbi:hypothetical protein BH20ACT21_BH20ACT21_03220 [soil metagenome]